MRLTFFGSRLPSADTNGAGAYFRGVLAALISLGHDVLCCEASVPGHEPADAPVDGAWYGSLETYRTEQERDALVRRALEDSDWVVKCSGVGTWDAELEWAIAHLHGRARTAFWDMEAPATLARIGGDTHESLREAVPRFDRIFTYGGGPRVVDAYTSLGARACTPLYDGLDPRIHCPPELPPQIRWDLLLTGNRHPDRDDRVGEFFFRAAAELPEARFALAGAGWEAPALPDNVERLGYLPAAQRSTTYRAARLVLNVHRQSAVDAGWSPATQMFEAAGAAACQITDPWRGLTGFFARGREILVAESGAEVARLVRTIGQERAASIGRAAWRRALAEHTYERRAAQMDGLLQHDARRGARAVGVA